MNLTTIGDFLYRSKFPIDIDDTKEYIRVKIRIKHNGVTLRDKEIGKKIGTKKQFILKAGQFILSKIDARYGAFGIAPNEVDGAIITGNFWAYDVDKKKVSIEWFNQFTNSPVFYEVCERASSGITHRKYLDEEIFLKFEILLPTLKEQLAQVEKIKEIIASSHELKKEITHQQDLAKQLRKSFLQYAMLGKLVNQDREDITAAQLLQKIKAEKDKLVAEKIIKKEKPLPPIKKEDIPFDIHDNWIWCRLGELTLYSESGKSFKCEEIPVCGNEWGVIKVSAVSWDNFIETKNKIYSKTKPDDISVKIKVGDFLISRANTSELVGKSVIVKRISKNLLLSDKIIRFKFSNSVSIDYINLCNNSKYARIYYASKGTGSSPSMKNITRGHMNELLIPLPPFPEQLRIVNKLEQIIQKCDSIQDNIQESCALNTQLLQCFMRDYLKN